MKTQVIAIVALLAAAVVAVAEDATPSITVIGTAVTKGSPDFLRWRLSLTSVGHEVGALAEEHEKLTVQVLDFLTQQRISTAKIQTSQLRISENRVSRNQSWVMEGYVASTTVDFECDEVATYRDLWLGLSKIPRVMVASVEWDSSKRMEIQKRTRADALRAALAKAQEMADVLGSSVGEPIEVYEDVFINDGRRSPPACGSSGE